MKLRRLRSRIELFILENKSRRSKPLTDREIFKKYASAIAYIAVENSTGDKGIGSAFHVGDGVFITARHVVEHKKILSIATTISPDGGLCCEIVENIAYYRSSKKIKAGPFYHEDPTVDVAALVLEECDDIVAVPLGGHLDDWIGNEFILERCVILGYPQIPFSREPLLVAARAEVNAVLDKYTGGNPNFIISAMARGGFSGGLCFMAGDFALGLITESLVKDGSAPELGYLAVLTVEPIYQCLGQNRILPKKQDIFDGLFDPDRKREWVYGHNPPLDVP